MRLSRATSLSPVANCLFYRRFSLAGAHTFLSYFLGNAGWYALLGFINGPSLGFGWRKSFLGRDLIDPFRQKYFTRAPFSRIDDNETCFIYSKFAQPRWLSLFRSIVFKLFKQWKSEQFKFTSKWIVWSNIDRMQQF